MDEIATGIEVDAPARVVWAVVTDFEQYDEWNPRLRIDGRPVEGTTLTVRPGPKASGLAPFRPTVTRVEPECELAWRGHRVSASVFECEHRFRLHERPGGRTRLVQRGRFAGYLAGVVARLSAGTTATGFEAVNEAVKRRAESLVVPETAFPV